MFNDLQIQLTKEKNIIVDICSHWDEPSCCPESKTEKRTLVYKQNLDVKCNLHLLKPIDIDETGLDDESIFRYRTNEYSEKVSEQRNLNRKIGNQ